MSGAEISVTRVVTGCVAVLLGAAAFAGAAFVLLASIWRFNESISAFCSRTMRSRFSCFSCICLNILSNFPASLVSCACAIATLRQSAEDHPQRFLSFISFLHTVRPRSASAKGTDSLQSEIQGGLKVESCGQGVVEPDSNQQPLRKKKPKVGRGWEPSDDRRRE